MPKTSYITFDGEIVSEIGSAGQLDYMRDSLGSVTGTIDQTPAVQNQYWYKPFGAIQSSSGAGADPSFLWMAGSSFRSDGSALVDYYAPLNGNYLTAAGSFSTIQPNLQGPPYAIRLSNTAPVCPIDFTGGQPPGWCILQEPVGGDCGTLSKVWEIIWSVPQHYPTIGIIVQHIHKTQFTFGPSCDGSSPPPVNPQEWWEAWCVSSIGVSFDCFTKQTLASMSAEDWWSEGVNGVCMSGSIFQEGYAIYFPGQDFKQLYKSCGWTWGTGFGVPWGRLLHTTTAPAKWADAGGLDRTMKMSWDCCACNACVSEDTLVSYTSGATCPSGS